MTDFANAITNVLTDLVGRVPLRVTRNEKSLVHGGGENIRFEMQDGDVFELTHQWDCCESVNIEDVCGELESLQGLPILFAEETTSDAKPVNEDSATWTFYKIGNAAGTVTIRFFGESNGYYSEAAELVKVKR